MSSFPVHKLPFLFTGCLDVDNSESQQPKTGNKPYKRGKFTDVVLDIIGGERPRPYMGFSQSLKAVSLDCVKPRLHQSWPVNQEGWRFLPSIWWRQSLKTSPHKNTITPPHQSMNKTPGPPQYRPKRNGVLQRVKKMAMLIL